MYGGDGPKLLYCTIIGKLLITVFLHGFPAVSFGTLLPKCDLQSFLASYSYVDDLLICDLLYCSYSHGDTKINVWSKRISIWWCCLAVANWTPCIV